MVEKQNETTPKVWMLRLSSFPSLLLYPRLGWRGAKVFPVAAMATFDLRSAVLVQRFTNSCGISAGVAHRAEQSQEVARPFVFGEAVAAVVAISSNAEEVMSPYQSS